jgi:hypothetical protein
MLALTIQSVLLAFHNVALVIVAGAPFYFEFLLESRASRGTGYLRGTDAVITEAFLKSAPWTMVMLLVLGITGFGMPLNHRIMNGAFRDLNGVEAVAFAAKMVGVAILFTAAFAMNRGIIPQLAAVSGRFEAGSAGTGDEGQWTALVARRRLMLLAWRAGAGIALLSSAFLRFRG